MLTALFSVAVVVGAAGGPQSPDRSKPPAVGRTPLFQVPKPMVASLSNGLRMQLLQRQGSGLADVIAIVRSGALSDPRGLPGVADWTAAMLTEGAGGRDALTFAEAVDALGATIEAWAAWDSIGVWIHVPAARLAPALELMADAVLRPSFDPAEWERLAAKRRTAFLQARDSPWQLARLAWLRAIYPQGVRLSQAMRGTPASLERVRLDDLRAFHARAFQPENVVLVAVADLPARELQSRLEGVFGSWQAGAAAVPAYSPLPAAPGIERQVIIVDKPNAAQSIIAAVGHAPEALRPLDAPTEVMNTLLGGAFTSRLNQNLREEHGYSYGARSMVDLRRHGGRFVAYAAVATAVTGPAVQEMLHELDAIRVEASAKEVSKASQYRALTFPLGFATGRGCAWFLADAAALGIPFERVADFMERAAAVDSEALMAAARAVVDPLRLRVVVVGDRTKIEKGLAELGAGPIRVWQIDELVDIETDRATEAGPGQGPTPGDEEPR